MKKNISQGSTQPSAHSPAPKPTRFSHIYRTSLNDFHLSAKTARKKLKKFSCSYEVVIVKRGNLWST